ncbi:hypothetical protein M409DRAFT_70682 [Zasmidium cellare ATCC 36951]|uniref:ABC transporter domain-containing protein n=1 Tax=Zasmidium cellare ATCC 36951 TaxID=1080233 RepID=A0A6A6BZL2_ZASCE|nr:uncharacterized protein M409DRAFT_70682 [Zasmidium cellare ATCC 36951]KAF2160175.1 hypothetical protein M409DRAFT_70682 [Zasmidium cellare ATCC 36951]
MASNRLRWNTMPEFRAMQHPDNHENHGTRRLGIAWENLTVKGVAAEAAFNENIWSQFIPARLKKGHSGATSSTKTILENSHGCVKPGEMLLVLGRPGAGCTSLLEVLANRRAGFASIDGEVNYGSLDAKDVARYRGARDFLLKALGISHTSDTKIGDAFIRGVSGGERKRVSIIETMATRGSIYCWDNSTRGLDANTALQFVKAVRTMSDIFGLTSILTLYQAGNAIYELFDKVLVLEKGLQIYYGPAKSARQFMEDLGFVCADGANVADFLTSVTVPTERKIRPGFEMTFPRMAADILANYNGSSIRKLMASEYDHASRPEVIKNTQEFERSIAYEKHDSLLMRKSPVTVGFGTQLDAAVRRQVQIILGDKSNLIVKQGSNLIQAFAAGSLFYNAPDNSAGLFSKSGIIFVTILFNALIAQSEVTDSFTGRNVLDKHQSFAFYHPAAWTLAQTILDIPIILFQVSAFGVVAYFLSGLTSDAGVFFTFWFLIVSSTFCITALFRAVRAGFKTFDDASKFAGVIVMAVLMYAGYMIPKSEMGNWFVWIYWINPLAYAYNGLLSNEFNGKVIDCVGPNLVPSGPGYTSTANKACTGVRGAHSGATSVTGTQYLDSLKYSHSDMWRSVGIVWVWWAFYVALTILLMSMHRGNESRKGTPLVPSERAKEISQQPQDVEAQSSEKALGLFDSPTDDSSTAVVDHNLVRNESTFTWKNVVYTVKTPDGPRVLLNNVHGWVKPGMLGALMGFSGAGKTTLLDVLAQRKTDGELSGAVLVDGQPLTASFQRSAGSGEQLDVHEALTTVREALEISALLRQPHTTSKADKLKYVDVIIDLLKLRDIEDCLVGTADGPGLSVEQRKRLTIGVELVAKPSVVIFMDEPTSGLDGQAAYNVVRFLKKLAAAGQAILVTIHQPSAQLFCEFDSLFLLAKGGNTVYFGDIGENGDTVRDYFASYGAPCPPEMNIAEHMIDVVTDTKTKDWSQVWLDSPQHAQVLEQLDSIVQVKSRQGSYIRGTDYNYEFAMPLWEQIKIVSKRASTVLYRNTGYINNKLQLYILTGLFTGFSFWQLGYGVGDMQLRMFALFNFIFVAPGVIAQLQPLFIEKRDIYDAREKKSKMYSWIAFVTGLIVSELPYLVICAVLFFFCFYYTVGFRTDSDKAGAVFFVFLMYEFMYTGIGQFIAAYAPSAVAASLVNPLVIFTLVGFSGVLVPYSQIVDSWKYWLYYINPFNYLMGSLLVFTTFDIDVVCKESELAIFDPGANLLNPSASSGCQVCAYTSGGDYLRTMNLNDYYYGWRNAAIVVLFVMSSYGLVFLLMKLRTKKTKKVE